MPGLRRPTKPRTAPRARCEPRRDLYEVMWWGAFRLWFGMSAGGLPVLAAPAAWEGPVFVEISAGPVHPGQQATSSLRRGVRKNSLTLDVACP